MIVAEIVPHHKLPPVCGKTYTVKELYKYVPSGGAELDLIFFDGDNWVADSGKHSKKRLNKIVEEAMIAALGTWRGDLPVICRNPSFFNTVTEQLQLNLYDLEFFLRLDSNSMRKYFVYKGGVVEDHAPAHDARHRGLHGWLRVSRAGREGASGEAG